MLEVFSDIVLLIYSDNACSHTLKKEKKCLIRNENSAKEIYVLITWSIYQILLFEYKKVMFKN